MRRFTLLLCLPALCGCYLLTQAQGQLRLLLNSRSIDKLLADRSVPDDIKLKLLLVREIKAFGEQDLGLKPSSNYESFYDTKGQPITYIVSASRKDRFEPYIW
ncbi:MAG: aminopeptidase, partial [Planctomycetes bacterium]|nr:aminopeptidase [Planctomycetota bacterium]